MLSYKPWRPEAIIQFILGIFACLFAGILVVGLLRHVGAPGFQTPNGPGSILASTLCFQGAAWGMIFLFLKRHGVPLREAFGLRDENLGRALGKAILTLLVVLPSTLLLQKISILTMTHLGWMPQEQIAVEMITDSKAPWLQIYLGFFAIVLAPVAEEFIFRGMLFPFIKQLGFPKLAWIGVSFLFALIHMNAPTFVPLFFFALAQTWLYARTDNLLAPITVHALFNASNLVILHFVQ
jgi:membrane protease YdiL (CAAX protease family)